MIRTYPQNDLNTMDFRIRNLQKKDIPALIEIHLATLEIGLLSKMGKHYLQNIFYPSLLKHHAAFCYVVENHAGQPIGGAIYIHATSLFQILGYTDLIKTGFYLCKTLMKQPKIIK